MENENTNITTTDVTTVETNGQTEQTNVQENNSTVDATQNVQENAVESPTTPVEGQGDINTQVDSNLSTTGNVEASNETSDDVTELRRQLDEYKLKEEELLNLSQRLGTDKQGDTQIAAAYQQLEIVNNQAQQAYIQLCNEFGVDYRPDKIEASAKELLEKNPQGYYDLQYRLNQLDTIVENKRAEVGNFIYNRQLQAANNKYANVLNASPAMKEALNAYMGVNRNVNPIEAMDGFMNLAAPMYREAFEYGKLYAQQEAIKAAQQPKEILNNSTIATSTSHTIDTPPTLTLADVEKMDVKTYAKNAALIDKLYAEGKLK